MQVGPVVSQPLSPVRQPLVQAVGRVAHAAEARPVNSEENRETEREQRQASRSVTTKTGTESEATSSAKGAAPTAPNGEPLTPEDLAHLEQLKVNDRAVRQHEMTHQIVGGVHAGGASYEYEVGPDGKRYAVAGEVSIDYGAVKGDPQATIEKMEKVIAAALAPADPSVQDRKVAAMARQTLVSARLELAQLQTEMNAARSADVSTSASTAEAASEQRIDRAIMAGQPAGETLRTLA